MLSHEEKHAIEYLKARLYGNEGCKFIDVAQSDLRIFLKLVENLQKDNESWKDKIKTKIEKYKEKCKNCNFKGKICEDLTKNYNCTIAVCLNEFYTLLRKE